MQQKPIMGIMGAVSVCMLKPKIKANYLQMKSHMNMHITLTNTVQCSSGEPWLLVVMLKTLNP